MRKQTALALFIVVAALAIPTLPAHAGLGGLLKAAAKAGSVGDDAARGAAKLGTHADDAAVAARHADDATVGAVVVDGAAADAQHARAAKEAKDGSLAGDVAE